MNIETQLDERLKSAIQSTYNSRNYKGAILDAMHFISDLIREKTGLQSDGAALAGQALGGKTPKLKVNKLETESEWNIQSGLEQILRGLYQAIRNPRSHGKHTDKQEDADAIILFINYLTNIIDQSKAPFTINEFIDRVFDVNFVEKERYAELLASEIPPKYRLEVMLDIIRKRETGDGKKLAYFVTALLPKLTKEQCSDLYANISQDLKITHSEAAIRTILQIFPGEFMSHLDEAARLRTENNLIQSISEGTYDEEFNQCQNGAFGTWASTCCENFLLKEDLINTLTNKLSSKNIEGSAYVFKYFWQTLLKIANPPPKRLINVIKMRLRGGDRTLYQKLSSEQLYGDAKWVAFFKTEMELFKERKPTAEPTDDNEIPF